MDNNSLSHTKWNCKYHIVFAPKYRRKVAYGKIKQDIANILSMLCKRKGVKIVEAEICPDHAVSYTHLDVYKRQTKGLKIHALHLQERFLQ